MIPVFNKPGTILLLAGFLVLTLLPGFFSKARSGTLSNPFPAPEFTHTTPGAWINSAPVTTADLRGKVILIDFWTYGCWNCYRSFPWLTQMESRLPEKHFRVIGVHTPEFDHEKIRENIITKTREYGLEHPVMIDNDHSYWNAMRNRYWPAYYILDKNGLVRAVFFGETHEGDEQAKRIEKTIKLLIDQD